MSELQYCCCSDDPSKNEQFDRKYQFMLDPVGQPLQSVVVMSAMYNLCVALCEQKIHQNQQQNKQNNQTKK